MQATKYTSTVRITDLSMMKAMSLKPGQWVNIMGARGQYMGTTAAGTDIIRWQSEGRKFGQGGTSTKTDAVNNGRLRQYAKSYGAK